VPDPHTPPDIVPSKAGISLNAAISRGIVASMKKYFGKGPESAKSYMLDDFLLIVMRGSQTQAEATMVEFDQEDLVRNFRQQFENEMTSRLIGMVEELTGRKVLGYQSQLIFEPEVVVELFFFDREADASEKEATARGQLEEPSIGEAEEQAHDEDVSGDVTASQGGDRQQGD
jgi:uncharacterized protein YbcI